MRSVASDIADIKCNNEIFIETYETNDEFCLPSSHRGMWGLILKLFTFDLEFISLYYGLWLSLMLIIIIFDVNYDDIWCCFCLSDVYFYFHYSGKYIPYRKQNFWSWKKQIGIRCSSVEVLSLRKIWVMMIHNLCQGMRRRLKG